MPFLQSSFNCNTDLWFWRKSRNCLVLREFSVLGLDLQIYDLIFFQNQELNLWSLLVLFNFTWDFHFRLFVQIESLLGYLDCFRCQEPCNHHWKNSNIFLPTPTSLEIETATIHYHSHNLSRNNYYRVDFLHIWNPIIYS